MRTKLPPEVKIALNRLKGYASIGPVRLPLDRRLISPVIERALAKGHYEGTEVEMACGLVRPGDCVLELGAGLGVVSASIRHKTDAGRIVCFEANPRLIPYIQRVHALSDAAGIELRNAVVLPAPDSDTIAFHLHEDMWASALSDAAADNAVETVLVATERLSDVFSEIAPDVLVMDIEGAETDILEAEDLGSVKRMVVELHPDRYGPSGLSRALAAIDMHGFKHTEHNRTVYAFQR
jgi:FkbM family methyltransferase